MKDKRKRRDVIKGIRFLGNIVTRHNRIELLKDFENRYMDIAKRRIADPDDNFESKTDEELLVDAKKYARAELQKHKIHYKAFLKGYKTYKFLGRINPVNTDEFLNKQLKNSPQEPVDVKLPNSYDEEE